MMNPMCGGRPTRAADLVLRSAAVVELSSNRTAVPFSLQKANQADRAVFAGPVLTGLPLVIDGHDRMIDTVATRERLVRK